MGKQCVLTHVSAAWKSLLFSPEWLEISDLPETSWGLKCGEFAPRRGCPSRLSRPSVSDSTGISVVTSLLGLRGRFGS